MKFRVYFERTVVTHRTLEVEAASAREAEVKAREILREADNRLDSDFYNRRHWGHGDDSARITGSEAVEESA